ncbi:hypothetical protein [Bacillus toyonensis]|uniref:hypothetical protein n=1 Tax=Bacillus toyonensis TaxID=155322 RepID=UPI002E237196|nr:hypothetical protein [Bacillus toyonensis]
MGKKWTVLLLVILMSFAGCSSTESEKASKKEDKTSDKPTESKEVAKEDDTAAKEPIASDTDIRTKYLDDMHKELRYLYAALKGLQNHIDVSKTDKEVPKTELWKDGMNKGYSAVESVNTNIKTYPEDKIPSDLKENHKKLVDGLALLVKSKEFLIRGIPENSEEVISAGNLFVKQGTNLVDPATNFILDQK